MFLTVDGSIPHWNTQGETIVATDDYLRLTPAEKSLSAGLWTQKKLQGNAWELEVSVRINGPDVQGAGTTGL